MLVIPIFSPELYRELIQNKETNSSYILDYSLNITIFTLLCILFSEEYSCR